MLLLCAWTTEDLYHPTQPFEALIFSGGGPKLIGTNHRIDDPRLREITMFSAMAANICETRVEPLGDR